VGVLVSFFPSLSLLPCLCSVGFLWVWKAWCGFREPVEGSFGCGKEARRELPVGVGSFGVV
jgi:hypothetical protein